MQVTIQNVPWRFQHGLIRRCCSFVLSKFLTGQKLFHIEVNVVGVRGMFEKEGALGYCSIDDTHFGTDKKVPVWFTIELDTAQDLRTFFVVLCHELVHVKQYALGQLKESYHPTYSRTWKDKDITNRYYSQCPHEQEAYRREVVLYKEFMGQCGLNFEFVGPVQPEM